MADVENDDFWGGEGSQDQVDRVQPKEEGVEGYITKIEFIKGDNITQTRYLFVEKKGNDNIHREVSQNLVDPFSGDPQYRAANIKNFIMLFQSLNGLDDYDKLKGAVAEKLGDTFKQNPTHEAFHNALMEFLLPNFQTIEVKHLFCYPIKKGEASRYIGRPTVGNFIQSTHRNKDLAPWNPAYMSLVPGESGGKTPDSKTGVAERPKSKKGDF